MHTSRHQLEERRDGAVGDQGAHIVTMRIERAVVDGGERRTRLDVRPSRRRAAGESLCEDAFCETKVSAN